MNIEVKGLDECIKMLQKLKETLKSEELFKYIAEKSIKIINKYASERLENNSNYIEANKYDIISNGVIIHNDVKNPEGEYYSLIIEYGSGVYAELPHIGTTEEFIESNYTSWISGLGVRVTGQEAKHIYTDAAKEIEKNLSKWTSEFIKSKMK